MSFLDALLGRTRPVKSHLERLFAMSTAYVTLNMNLGLKWSEHGGICFRPISSTRFASMESDLQQLLHLSAKETDTQVRTTQDNYGFQWVVLEDAELEDLVATLHLISQTLQEQGFGEQLLAAVFKFLDGERPVYWIYNYKRGKFYPLVPAAGDRQRDNAAELRLRSLMERELPIEEDLERWYPLWGIPL